MGKHLEIVSKKTSHIAVPQHSGRVAGRDMTTGLLSDNRFVLLPVNPRSIYAYWNVTLNNVSNAAYAITPDPLAPFLFLRLHACRPKPKSGGDPFPSVAVMEKLLGSPRDRCYLAVSPDADYVAEIGFKTGDDHFHCLIRSNNVRTPREEPVSAFLSPEALGVATPGQQAGVFPVVDRAASLRQSVALPVGSLSELMIRGCVYDVMPPDGLAAMLSKMITHVCEEKFAKGLSSSPAGGELA